MGYELCMAYPTTHQCDGANKGTLAQMSEAKKKCRDEDKRDLATQLCDGMKLTVYVPSPLAPTLPSFPSAPCWNPRHTHPPP